jgi:ABC-type dipeptide/oligopeptide/nickel transport system permease component
MITYVIRRLLYLIPSLLLASLLTYTIGFYAPGDPLRHYLGEELYQDVQARERLRSEMGLDRPFIVQYGEWLSGLVQGDLGQSIVAQRSINQMLASAWPVSAQLGLAAMVIWFTLGITLGIVAALSHNTPLDYFIVSASVALSTVPPFVLGPMLMILFILKIPIIGSSFGWDGILSEKVILPATVIASAGLANLVRQTRASILETLPQNYVRTARAKGLSEWVVILRHVGPNAFTPILSIATASFSSFITGSFFAERIFNIHGYGWLAYDATVTVDYRLLVVTTTIAAAVVMVMNVVVDLLYGVLDPRVRVGKKLR